MNSFDPFKNGYNYDALFDSLMNTQNDPNMDRNKSQRSAYLDHYVIAQKAMIEHYKNLKPGVESKSDSESLGAFRDIPEELIKVIFENLKNNSFDKGTVNLMHVGEVCHTFHHIAVEVLKTNDYSKVDNKDFKKAIEINSFIIKNRQILEQMDPLECFNMISTLVYDEHFDVEDLQIPEELKQKIKTGEQMLIAEEEEYRKKQFDDGYYHGL